MPRLTGAFKAAQDTARTSAISQAVASTAASYQKLLNIERRAFALITSNQAAPAQALLDSEEYAFSKRQYAAGMVTLELEVRRELIAGDTARRERLATTISLSAILAALALLALALAIQKLRQWRQVLGANHRQLELARSETHRLNNELEQRVIERTRELQNSQEHLQSMLNNAAIVLFALDENGVFTLSEGAALTTLGSSPGAAVGQSAYTLFHDNEIALAHLRNAYSGEGMRTEFHVGNIILDIVYTPIFNLQDKVTSVIGVGTDITEKTVAESRAHSMAQVVSQHPAGIAIVNLDGIILYANERLLEIMHRRGENLVGADWSELRSDNTSQRQTQRLRNMVAAGHHWQGEFLYHRSDGKKLWLRSTLAPMRNAANDIHQYMYMVEDNSEQKRTNERLIRQTYLDVLTGLPNRKMALERIHTALKRETREITLILLDIDHFKRINDDLGHEVGDQLVAEVANTVTSCTSSGDTVARLGGDEFLIILDTTCQPGAVKALATKILLKLARSYLCSGEEINITASAGISIAPQDGADAQTLLRNVDTAMYQAKAAGRNTYRFFNADIEKQKKQRAALAQGLRGAISGGELSLHYQPIINLNNGQADHAEALLRWDSPEFGSVPPDRFIPIAEESELIIEIGDWVLREACIQSRAWRDAGISPMTIAVNLSPPQFMLDGFSQGVIRILEETGARPQDIELEITERLLISDTPSVANKLQQLDALGVKLCVDDFGTGYSALSYLKHYPVDTLKIDRIFVRDVVHDSTDAELAAGIINIGHGLSMQVTGEGVETREQLDFLRAKGCDRVQGYYFSKPLAPEDFVAWLDDYGASMPATSLSAAQ